MCVRVCVCVRALAGYTSLFLYHSCMRVSGEGGRGGAGKDGGADIAVGEEVACSLRAQLSIKAVDLFFFSCKSRFQILIQLHDVTWLAHGLSIYQASIIYTYTICIYIAYLFYFKYSLFDL